jgi:molybdenum cofactor cytidylyltransferase
LNFSFAATGQRIAAVKSAPFAISKEKLNAVIAILKERGPILQARPVRNPVVGILYSDAVNGDRARQLFEHIMRQRLERFGVSAKLVLACVEEENAVARSLQHLLSSQVSVILIASTTAPAGPEDVVGRAMDSVGGQMERFLVPVEPGNLLLLAYKDDVPIISAPGCFRSAKPNVIDLVLPPLLARYRVSGWELGCLGHGGLLLER